LPVGLLDQEMKRTDTERQTDRQKVLWHKKLNAWFYGNESFM